MWLFAMTVPPQAGAAAELFMSSLSLAGGDCLWLGSAAAGPFYHGWSRGECALGIFFRQKEGIEAQITLPGGLAADTAPPGSTEPGAAAFVGKNGMSAFPEDRTQTGGRSFSSIQRDAFPSAGRSADGLLLPY